MNTFVMTVLLDYENVLLDFIHLTGFHRNGKTVRLNLYFRSTESRELLLTDWLLTGGTLVNIDWYTFMILHLCRTLMQIDHQTKSETEMDWIWSVAFDWISVPTCGKDLGLALGRQANQLFVTPCSKYSNVTDQTSAFLLTLINPGTMLMPVYIACISLKMFCQLFHRHS